jgi:hypothetical protein
MATYRPEEISFGNLFVSVKTFVELTVVLSQEADKFNLVGWSALKLK